MLISVIHLVHHHKCLHWKLMLHYPHSCMFNSILAWNVCFFLAYFSAIWSEIRTHNFILYYTRRNYIVHPVLVSHFFVDIIVVMEKYYEWHKNWDCNMSFLMMQGRWRLQIVPFWYPNALNGIALMIILFFDLLYLVIWFQHFKIEQLMLTETRFRGSRHTQLWTSCVAYRNKNHTLFPNARILIYTYIWMHECVGCITPGPSLGSYQWKYSYSTPAHPNLLALC